MKRVFSALFVLCLLLCGCTGTLPAEPKRYTATFLDLFDTVTTIVGYANSEEEFRTQTQAIHDDLLHYHRLFDIYTDYEGLNNLKTLNDRAGEAPVEVHPDILALLGDCKTYYDLSGGKVNVAMGGVLHLWHKAREQGINDPANAALPDMQALQAAAEHMSMQAVVLDERASTVYFTDPALRLDVGAVAKGWAAQRAAEKAPSGMLISVGGNVCATGPKPQDESPWVIGIQDPDDGDSNLHTVFVSSGSVVTSGDYQRGYWVDGQRYHHIIDDATLMPARYWRSVSVLCADSGLADALSTALFLMDREAGAALAGQCGADAMWVDRDGKEYFTPGFEEKLRT